MKTNTNILSLIFLSNEEVLVVIIQIIEETVLEAGDFLGLVNR